MVSCFINILLKHYLKEYYIFWNIELEVLSRSIRICLFDGVSVLSNIHTIRAHVVGKEERTWEFDDENDETVQITDYSEFFIRCKSYSDKPNLGLLFELSVYTKKKVKYSNRKK